MNISKHFLGCFAIMLFVPDFSLHIRSQMESKKQKQAISLAIAGVIKNKEYCRSHNRIDLVVDALGVEYYIQVRPHLFNTLKAFNEGDPVKVSVTNLMRTNKRGKETSRFNNLILEKCQKL